ISSAAGTPVTFWLVLDTALPAKSGHLGAILARGYTAKVTTPAPTSSILVTIEVVMPSIWRSGLASAAAALIAASPLFAFDTPLSEQAVREAYFLGQRRDDSLARLLDKYTKYLDAPRSGPHIASMTFFTPFALVAQLSSQHAAGYSAQQAQLDHKARA